MEDGCRSLEEAMKKNFQPVKIIEKDKHGRFVLVKNDFKQILKLLPSSATHLAILSVVGERNSGKSYLINLLLQYLKTGGEIPTLNPPREKEFSGHWPFWKYSFSEAKKIDSDFIYMWPQPFFLTSKTENVIWILLMDAVKCEDSPEYGSVEELLSLLSTNLIDNHKGSFKPSLLTTLETVGTSRNPGFSTRSKSKISHCRKITFVIGGCQEFNISCHAQALRCVKEAIIKNEISSESLRLIFENLKNKSVYFFKHPIAPVILDADAGQVESEMLKHLCDFVSDNLEFETLFNNCYNRIDILHHFEQCIRIVNSITVKASPRTILAQTFLKIKKQFCKRKNSLDPNDFERAKTVQNLESQAISSLSLSNSTDNIMQDPRFYSKNTKRLKQSEVYSETNKKDVATCLSLFTKEELVKKMDRLQIDKNIKSSALNRKQKLEEEVKQKTFTAGTEKEINQARLTCSDTKEFVKERTIFDSNQKELNTLNSNSEDFTNISHSGETECISSIPIWNEYGEKASQHNDNKVQQPFTNLRQKMKCNHPDPENEASSSSFLHNIHCAGGNFGIQFCSNLPQTSEIKLVNKEKEIPFHSDSYSAETLNAQDNPKNLKPQQSVIKDCVNNSEEALNNVQSDSFLEKPHPNAVSIENENSKSTTVFYDDEDIALKLSKMSSNQASTHATNFKDTDPSQSLINSEHKNNKSYEDLCRQVGHTAQLPFTTKAPLELKTYNNLLGKHIPQVSTDDAYHAAKPSKTEFSLNKTITNANKVQHTDTSHTSPNTSSLNNTQDKSNKNCEDFCRHTDSTIELPITTSEHENINASIISPEKEISQPATYCSVDESNELKPSKKTLSSNQATTNTTYVQDTDKNTSLNKLLQNNQESKTTNDREIIYRHTDSTIELPITTSKHENINASIISPEKEISQPATYCSVDESNELKPTKAALSSNQATTNVTYVQATDSKQSLNKSLQNNQETKSTNNREFYNRHTEYTVQQSFSTSEPEKVNTNKIFPGNAIRLSTIQDNALNQAITFAPKVEDTDQTKASLSCNQVFSIANSCDSLADAGKFDVSLTGSKSIVTTKYDEDGQDEKKSVLEDTYESLMKTQILLQCDRKLSIGNCEEAHNTVVTKLLMKIPDFLKEVVDTNDVKNKINARLRRNKERFGTYVRELQKQFDAYKEQLIKNVDVEITKFVKQSINWDVNIIGTRSLYESYLSKTFQDERWNSTNTYEFDLNFVHKMFKQQADAIIAPYTDLEDVIENYKNLMITEIKSFTLLSDSAFIKYHERNVVISTDNFAGNEYMIKILKMGIENYRSQLFQGNKQIQQLEKNSAIELIPLLLKYYQNEMKTIIENQRNIFSNLELEKLHAYILGRCLNALQKSCNLQGDKTVIDQVTIEMNESFRLLKSQILLKITELNAHISKAILARKTDYSLNMEKLVLGINASSLQRIHEETEAKSLKELEEFIAKLKYNNIPAKDHIKKLTKEIQNEWTEFKKMYAEKMNNLHSNQPLFRQQKIQITDLEIKSADKLVCSAENLFSPTRLPSRPNDDPVANQILPKHLTKNSIGLPPIAIELTSTSARVGWIRRGNFEPIISNGVALNIPFALAITQDREILIGEDVETRSENIKTKPCMQSIFNELTQSTFYECYTKVVPMKVWKELLIALFLSKLKKKVEVQLRGQWKTVVITVPLWYTSVRRQCTKDAAIIAGFDQVYLLNEPSAAVLAYSRSFEKQNKIKKKFVVVGEPISSCFDVSVYNYYDGCIELISKRDYSFSKDFLSSGSRDKYINEVELWKVLEDATKEYKCINNECLLLNSLIINNLPRYIESKWKLNSSLLQNLYKTNVKSSVLEGAAYYAELLAKSGTGDIEKLCIRDAAKHEFIKHQHINRTRHNRQGHIFSACEPQVHEEVRYKITETLSTTTDNFEIVIQEISLGKQMPVGTLKIPNLSYLEHGQILHVTFVLNSDGILKVEDVYFIHKDKIEYVEYDWISLNLTNKEILQYQEEVESFIIDEKPDPLEKSNLIELEKLIIEAEQRIGSLTSTFLKATLNKKIVNALEVMNNFKRDEQIDLAIISLNDFKACFWQATL